MGWSQMLAALKMWVEHGINLRENIAPTRERARLVLETSHDHSVRRIRLRRV